MMAELLVRNWMLGRENLEHIVRYQNTMTGGVIIAVLQVLMTLKRCGQTLAEAR